MESLCVKGCSKVLDERNFRLHGGNPYGVRAVEAKREFVCQACSKVLDERNLALRGAVQGIAGKCNSFFSFARAFLEIYIFVCKFEFGGIWCFSCYL